MSRFPSRCVRGRPRARLAGLALALVLATLASTAPRASGSEPAARGAARARATWHDARRTARGPLPNDAGDAAARAARARAEGAHGLEPSQKQTRARRPEPAHDGWGARRGHVTRGGSGRDGLGAMRDEDSFSARRRRELLVDESAASAEAADAANAIWPNLAEVPPLLRCSGCELTLAALHARAATAARRLSPPSWIVAAEETKSGLVYDNWNGACGALAADARLRVVDGAFFAGDAFITRVWEEATDHVLSGNANGTRANGTRAETSVETSVETSADANATVPPAPPPAPPAPAPPPSPPAPSYSFPEGFEGVDSDAFNVTRAAISVCALLRRDARAKAHLTSVVVSGGVYPFARGFIAAQCALVTADASCEGRAPDFFDARDEL